MTERTVSEIKEKIQWYLDRPDWSGDELEAVKQFVNLAFENEPIVAMQSVPLDDAAEVEKLRKALLSILNDFDISISKNTIVFQKTDKKGWWHSNYPWLLAAIGTAISVATGIISIIKMIQTWK